MLSPLVLAIPMGNGNGCLLTAHVKVLYAMAENASRNILRNTCRQNVNSYLMDVSSLVSPGDGYGVPNDFANVSEWMADLDPQDRCGYQALEIRQVREGGDGSMAVTRAVAGIGGGSVRRRPLTFSPSGISHRCAHGSRAGPPAPHASAPAWVAPE